MCTFTHMHMCIFIHVHMYKYIPNPYTYGYIIHIHTKYGTFPSLLLGNLISAGPESSVSSAPGIIFNRATLNSDAVLD